MLKTKLEVYKITNNEKTKDISDLKSIFGDKEGILHYNQYIMSYTLF